MIGDGICKFNNLPALLRSKYCDKILILSLLSSIEDLQSVDFELLQELKMTFCNFNYTTEILEEEYLDLLRKISIGKNNG